MNEKCDHNIEVNRALLHPGDHYIYKCPDCGEIVQVTLTKPSEDETKQKNG